MAQIKNRICVIERGSMTNNILNIGAEKPLLSMHLEGKKPPEIKAFGRWSVGGQNDLSNSIWIAGQNA